MEEKKEDPNYGKGVGMGENSNEVERQKAKTKRKEKKGKDLFRREGSGKGTPTKRVGGDSGGSGSFMKNPRKTVTYLAEGRGGAGRRVVCEEEKGPHDCE